MIGRKLRSSNKDKRAVLATCVFETVLGAVSPIWSIQIGARDTFACSIPTTVLLIDLHRKETDLTTISFHLQQANAMRIYIIPPSL